MSLKSITSTPLSLFVVCLVAFLTVSCGGATEGDSPTGPSPIPTPAPSPAPEPAPAPPPAPAPSGPGLIEVTIEPNPVPYFGQPLSNCSLPHTWQYEQKLRNAGGSTVTLSDRENFFDGVSVSKQSGLGIVIQPGATFALTTRWCSANNIEHRAATNFTGSDAAGNRINVTGPTVRLLPR